MNMKSGTLVRYRDSGLLAMERKLSALLKKDSSYPIGAQVEIVADISFKNFPLKGRMAKIVALPDEDGDLGLEFEDSVKGGSLEGRGQEGHCLLVNKSHLKILEAK